MVASYHEGTLVRTYIRVPGSGFDVRAKPALCDLSRVSTVVAPLPLHTGIGFITTNSTVCLKNNTHPTTVTTPSSWVNVQRTKRPREDRNNSSPTLKMKKRCVQPLKSPTEVESVKTNIQQTRKTNDLKKSDFKISSPELPENHSLGKLEKESRKAHPTINNELHNKSLLHQNKELLLKTQASALSQMLIKNHQLKQENVILQRQIDLFKQLIKDTKRIKAVINKLNSQNNPK